MKCFARRWTSILLIVLMLFTLTACGDKLQTPGASNTPSVGGDPTLPSGATTVAPPSGEADISLLEDEGWINFNHGFSQVPMAFSDDGIYYTSLSGHLRYFDKATGMSFTLCHKVGCLHEEEEDREKYRECESIIGHPKIFFFWNGGIYFDVSTSHGQELYRREADGTAEQKVAEICADYRGADLSCNIYDTLFVEGSLYYRANVNKQETENGVTTTLSTEYVLLHLDLASGEERELLRMKEEDGSFSMLAGHKDAVLVETTAAYDRKPGDLEALYNAQQTVQLLSPNAAEPKTLLQMTYRELGHTVYLSGGELYSKSINSQTGRVLNLLTGEQREYILPGEQFYGPYYKKVTRVDEETSQWTVFNAQTGETYENELKDIGCISDRYADASGVVLELRYKEGTSEKVTLSYCYIAYAKMADGLQKEDFMEVISRSNRG